MDILLRQPTLLIPYVFLGAMVLALVIAIVVLIKNYRRTKKGADFSLPDLDQGKEKEVFKSTVSDKIPEVKEKEIEEIISNIDDTHSLIDGVFEDNSIQLIESKKLPKLGKVENINLLQKEGEDSLDFDYDNSLNFKDSLLEELEE